jgi:hypothetical protein
MVMWCHAPSIQHQLHDTCIFISFTEMEEQANQESAYICQLRLTSAWQRTAWMIHAHLSMELHWTTTTLHVTWGVQLHQICCIITSSFVSQLLLQQFFLVDVLYTHKCVSTEEMQLCKCCHEESCEGYTMITHHRRYHHRTCNAWIN